MTRWIAGIAALAALSGAAVAAPASKSSTKPSHKMKEVLVCPVQHTPIKSAKDAAGFSIYKGVKYYFCCPGCKPEFDKNPAKFVK